MNSAPLIISGVEAPGNDLRLESLVKFLGLECDIVDTRELDARVSQAADRELCVIASATTLSRWCQEQPVPLGALERLLDKVAALFVYGFSPAEACVKLAAMLSGGEISNVKNLTKPNLRYKVERSHPGITFTFSGLSFGGVRTDIDFGFVDRGDAVVPLISIAGMPMLALLRRHGCSIVLSACTTIADVYETSLDDNVDATAYFSRLLPATMFLGNRCWHSDQAFANFIIDDPPLKRSYGYLNYRKLLALMDETGFASTIAFIPWNHDRSDSGVAQMFRERSDRLSLCVHGSDHTASEFAISDLGRLNRRVRSASMRMAALRDRTGVDHVKVMVFPQGRFSPQALTALKANNYVAAMNSPAQPASLKAPISLAEFLNPALTKYDGFPLFLRRYPGSLEQFAFDLFFGKPALIVEHHGYLSDGGRRLREFITNLNALQAFRWAGMPEIMAGSYLKRERSDGVVDCRLSTNCHSISNTADSQQKFVFTKDEWGDVPIAGILVNGQAVEYVTNDISVAFEAKIPAHASVEVRIVYKSLLPLSAPNTRPERTRVWTRRMLSEFRDNVLWRSKFWLSRAQKLTDR